LTGLMGSYKRESKTSENNLKGLFRFPLNE
jgi:hypothetical protein